MTLTVRLPPVLESELKAALDGSGKPVSEFVREAIAEKLAREAAARPSPYAQGAHLFGRHGSGRDDLSERAEPVLREKLRARHRG